MLSNITVKVYRTRSKELILKYFPNVKQSHTQIQKQNCSGYSSSKHGNYKTAVQYLKKVY